MAHIKYVAAKKHYINNAEFYKEICNWRENDPENITSVPDSIWEFYQKIINKKANKYNFRDYTYLDEMKSSAMELCVRASRKFKYLEYNNPYWYFDTIILNAFLIVIKKEKKLNDYRYGKMEETLTNQRQLNNRTITTSNRDQYGNYFDPYYNYMDEDDNNFWNHLFTDFEIEEKIEDKSKIIIKTKDFWDVVMQGSKLK